MGVWSLGFVAGLVEPHAAQGNAGRLSDLHAAIANPLGIPALKGVAAVAVTISILGALGAGLASIASLILRSRRATTEEREQIRWLGYVGIAGLGLLLFLVLTIPLGGPTNQIFGGIFWFGIVIVFAFGLPVEPAWG